MAIKDILKQIASKLPEDSGEVKALVADAIREADDILDTLSSANKESAGRKQKIRELESERDTLKDSLEKALGNDQKAEIERLKKIEAQYQAIQTETETKIKTQWAEKAKVFSGDKTSKLFEKAEKVKSRFILPTEGSELTIDQIKKNLEAFTLLEETGYFTAETKETGGGAPNYTDPSIPTSSGDALLKISKRGN